MINEETKIPLSKAIIYGAIIIAVVIAGGMIYQKNFTEKKIPEIVKKTIDEMTPNPKNTPAVTKDDHLLGDKNAPVKIVVYTDLECPYCKVFHQSIDELKDTYIKEGKVAIVYRNFPIDQLHSKARAEAEASECVAKLGGNDKYWSYIDKIFTATPSNNGLDSSLLVKFAEELGLNKETFVTCQKDEKIIAKVEAEITEAQKSGAQGTPYPIVIYKDEVKGSLPGAVPVDQMKEIIDQVIAEK